MFLCENYPYLKEPEVEYSQIFENNPNIVLPSTSVLQKANGRDREIIDFDIEIVKFIAQVKFATFEQLFRFKEYLMATDERFSKNLELQADKGFGRLRKFTSLRVLNRFAYSLNSDDYFPKVNNGEFIVYTLDHGGAKIMEAFTEYPQMYEYKITDAYKPMKRVFKELILTDFYLSTLGGSALSFNKNNRVFLNGDIFRPSSILIARQGDDFYSFLGEAFYKGDVYFSNQLFEMYDSLFSSKKVQAITQGKACLVLICEDKDTVLMLNSIVEKSHIDSFRFTTFEKLKEELWAEGALYKVKDGEVIPITGAYFSKI